jgi:hypothetical protein
MSLLRFPVAIILQRTPLAHRWASEQWAPAGVEPETPSAAGAPELLEDDAHGTRWRFRGHAIELHRSEAEGYHLNVTAPEPKVFVMWRMSEDPAAMPAAFPVIVTVSYNEAARMLDGGERVDSVPMPADVLEWLRPFVAEHYKPEPRRKVRRNDPFRDENERRGTGSRR